MRNVGTQSVVSKLTERSQSLKGKSAGTKDLERACGSGCDAHRSRAEAFPNNQSPEKGLPLRLPYPSCLAQPIPTSPVEGPC